MIEHGEVSQGQSSDFNELLQEAGHPVTDYTLDLEDLQERLIRAIVESGRRGLPSRGLLEAASAIAQIAEDIPVAGSTPLVLAKLVAERALNVHEVLSNTLSQKHMGHGSLARFEKSLAHIVSLLESYRNCGSLRWMISRRAFTRRLTECMKELSLAYMPVSHPRLDWTEVVLDAAHNVTSWQTPSASSSAWSNVYTGRVALAKGTQPVRAVIKVYSKNRNRHNQMERFSRDLEFLQTKKGRNFPNVLYSSSAASKAPFIVLEYADDPIPFAIQLDNICYRNPREAPTKLYGLIIAMQEAYRFLVEDKACISYYHLKNLTASVNLVIQSPYRVLMGMSSAICDCVHPTAPAADAIWDELRSLFGQEIFRRFNLRPLRFMGEQLLGYDIELTALQEIARAVDVPPPSASIFFDTGQLLSNTKIGDLGIVEKSNGVWKFHAIANVRHALPGWSHLVYDSGGNRVVSHMACDDLPENIVRLTVQLGSGEGKFVYSLLPQNFDPYELSKQWLRYRALESAERYEICPWNVLLVIGTGLLFNTHACQTARVGSHYVFVRLTDDGFPVSAWLSESPQPSEVGPTAEFSDYLEAQDVGLKSWLGRHHLYIQLESDEFDRDDQEYFLSKERERKQRQFYHQPDSYDYFSDCSEWFSE